MPFWLAQNTVKLRVMDTLTGDQSDRAKLIEALFYGYRTLGFDTDDCKHGECFLAHTGTGGNNLDTFIALMKRSFDEARADYDEACGIELMNNNQIPDEATQHAERVDYVTNDPLRIAKRKLIEPGITVSRRRG